MVTLKTQKTATTTTKMFTSVRWKHATESTTTATAESTKVCEDHVAVLKPTLKKFAATVLITIVTDVLKKSVDVRRGRRCGVMAGHPRLSALDSVERAGLNVFQANGFNRLRPPDAVTGSDHSSKRVMAWTMTVTVEPTKIPQTGMHVVAAG